MKINIYSVMSCHLVTIKIVNIYLDTIKENFSKICCVVGSGNGSRKYSKATKVFFWRQGRIQGGVLGVKTPLFSRNFFQFARVFQEKNPKTPLNFPVHTKKIQNPSLGKFLDTPLFGGIDNENVFLSKLTGNEHGLID